MCNLTVSIVCLTYNHEKYIVDALNGFLCQKTTFKFEILIGEDSSTDDTRKICTNYLNQYPDKIRIINSEKNLGYIENFLRTSSFAQGEYIALCEGDDFWTDPYKLQKQVNFLINNPDCAMVHTDKRILVGDKYFQADPVVVLKDKTFEDIIISNYICALTVLVRKTVFITALRIAFIPAKKYNWMTLDYPIFLEIALRNKIGYINEITGVHRLVPDSISHSTDAKKAFTFEKSVVSIKKYYIKEYLRISSENSKEFELRFFENYLNDKKRLIIDFKFKAITQLFDFTLLRPVLFFKVLHKRLSRVISALQER